MAVELIYLVFICATALAGYRVKSLSFSGAIGAVAVGYSVAIGFGVKGLLILGVFFASSSFWSKYKAAKKNKVEDKLEKGSSRDLTQVAANGGAAAAVSLLYLAYGHEILLLVFLVSIAAANSDTWASEIGVLSKRPPVFIRTFKRAEKGTSGAISATGTIAALAGSILIALCGILLFDKGLSWFITVAFFGFLGNLADTLLGAFFQAEYRCKSCRLKTEKKVHCGTGTVLIKGWPLFNNDMVNGLSICLAAAGSLLAGYLLF
ncbi:DUF92 domain-containing protein [Peribacillus saganii]|uniref:DUF92 domain-containing protein n=1 Tax=Peribacillus saganii TaxID=2303992 RepID=A0A372LDP7_9BACI|nr:DUF92 domain-containing protein [Peribacillus saganii]RFU64283.1 DUF92 domain-containing protein [Peribacillus saganii]